MKARLFFPTVVSAGLLLTLMLLCTNSEGALQAPFRNMQNFVMGRAYDWVLLLLTLCALAACVLSVVYLLAGFFPRHTQKGKLTFLASDGRAIEAENIRILAQLIAACREPGVEEHAYPPVRADKLNTLLDTKIPQRPEDG